MKTLGQRIRDLREDKDLSLRELAKKIQVSAAFLSDVELGRRYPSDKILASIAQKLGTTLKDLRNYDTRPPIEDLKRIASSDPSYAFALRKVIDKKITSKDLLKFIEKNTKAKKS